MPNFISNHQIVPMPYPDSSIPIASRAFMIEFQYGAPIPIEKVEPLPKVKKLNRYEILKNAAIAQLDRVPDYESEG